MRRGSQGSVSLRPGRRSAQDGLESLVSANKEANVLWRLDRDLFAGRFPLLVHQVVGHGFDLDGYLNQTSALRTIPRHQGKPFLSGFCGDLVSVESPGMRSSTGCSVAVSAAHAIAQADTRRRLNHRMTLQFADVTGCEPPVMQSSVF